MSGEPTPGRDPFASPSDEPRSEGDASGPGKADADTGASILQAVHDAFADRGEGRPEAPRATPESRSRSAAPTPRGRQEPAHPLLSPDPKERRAALARFAGATPQPQDIPRLARLVGADPDPENRAMAALALLPVAHRIPRELIHRGLGDPDDRARAAMVELAAARGPSSIPQILPLATERGSPLTQGAALGALPGLLAARGLGPEQLSGLLYAVAHLDPSILPAERSGFAALARGVGIDRLIDELEALDPRRPGAVRLLEADGSRAALGALAGLANDPEAGIRQAGQRAAIRLGAGPDVEAAGRAGAETPRGGGAPGHGPGGASEPPPEQDELIAALAAAMGDPEQRVRAAARSALETLDRALLTSWLNGRLGGGSAKEAILAARVAEWVSPKQAAAPLMARAAAIPPEDRGPLLSALATLGLKPDELSDLVRSIDPGTRQEAVRLAWQVGGRDVLPFFRGLLRESAGSVRMAVLEVFSESGDPSGLAAAQQVLEADSSAAVRATAVHLLASASAEVRVSALGRALLDPDPDVRALAVEVLPSGIAGEVAELLLRALQDADERVWQAAVRHLATLPDRDLPKLWGALGQSPPQKQEELLRWIERTNAERLAALARENARGANFQDRSLAIELAARAGTPESTSLVLGGLTDPDPRVRRVAAVTMTTLRTAAAVPELTRALSDPQPEVRVEVVRALGLIDDDDVLAVLLSALKDPEIRVREMAAEALTRWRSPGVARRLAAELSVPDLRRPVSELLEGLGASATAPLIEIVLHGDPEAAQAAAGVLEQVAGAGPFLAGLSSLDPGERLRSVEVLGALGGSDAARGLRSALLDPDERVRARAATLLGSLRDQQGMEVLKRAFLNDPVAEVSAAAEAALRRLGVMPAEGEGEAEKPEAGDAEGPGAWGEGSDAGKARPHGEENGNGDGSPGG